jgi:hypothetical protein
MKPTICIFLFALFFAQAQGQERPKPLKFDEFEVSQVDKYWPFDLIDLSKRVDRLLAQVKKMPSVKVYVIAYHARKSEYLNRRVLDYWADESKSKIAFTGKLGDENVILLNGGIRDTNSLEYWIVPKGSNSPVASPTYAPSEGVDCPDIYISENGVNLESEKPAEFKVSTYPKMELSYRWSASAGEIVEGQSGDTVKIDPKGAKRLTVYAEASGLPLPCNRVQFGTFNIGLRPYLFDDATRYNFSDLSARFQGFMVQLANNPTFRGYVIGYGSRNGSSAWERNAALGSIQRIIVFDKFDPSRVTLVDGGFREFNSVEMWILPPGVEPPKPAPSVDKEFVQTQKALRQRKR